MLRAGRYLTAGCFRRSRITDTAVRRGCVIMKYNRGGDVLGAQHAMVADKLALLLGREFRVLKIERR